MSRNTYKFNYIKMKELYGLVVIPETQEAAA